MKRTILATLILAVLAFADAPSTAAQPPPPPPIVQTPDLGTVFNDFVQGALNGSTAATPQENSRALATDDPFYLEPEWDHSAAPGTLLKAAKVEVNFMGVKPANVDAYRLMFVTTGIDGTTPALSTGIVLIPIDGKPASAKHVVSYQEANDSVGWYCHPSSQWTGGDPLDGASWSALGPLAMMFEKGYAVVISDVGNNADRSPHGVFAGKFAGHSELDAVRAAFHYTPAGLDPHAQVALFGIAGGGVGAGFAAEAQPTYAPELNVVSTVLEGMVVKPDNFMRVANGSVGSGFAFATLLGLEPWYPEMNIDSKLTPAGLAVANGFRTQCQMPAYFMMPFVPLQALFDTGRSPADEPAFQHAFQDNILGRSAPKSKVLITSCAGDDSPMSLVPAADSRDLADTYRAQGTDVTYQPSDCSIVHMLTNLYGWATDLCGMQTIEWLARSFD
ncbi:lipase family protein [Nocardia sp. NBC_01327]|uniref:lipase family protein n=1 Tax=Nocardia sp. NBC_01327 TaxID=2903593 RepID=UPI002E0E90ED|nr:lipase family protein [Nocardia sp. NBC_01327]